MNARGDAWLQGFVERATDSGVPYESIPQLLKSAAEYRLHDDENFSEGFNTKLAEAGIDKEAALLSTLAMLGLLGAGIWQGGKWVGKGINKIHRGFSPSANRDYLMDQHMKARSNVARTKAEFDAATSGILNQRKAMGLGVPGAPTSTAPAPVTKSPWMYSGSR